MQIGLQYRWRQVSEGCAGKQTTTAPPRGHSLHTADCHTIHQLFLAGPISFYNIRIFQGSKVLLSETTTCCFSTMNFIQIFFISDQGLGLSNQIGNQPLVLINVLSSLYSRDSLIDKALKSFCHIK